MGTEPIAPTVLIRLPSMTSTDFSMGGFPVASISRAPSRTTVPAIPTGAQIEIRKKTRKRVEMTPQVFIFTGSLLACRVRYFMVSRRKAVAHCAERGATAERGGTRWHELTVRDGASSIS